MQRSLFTVTVASVALTLGGCGSKPDNAQAPVNGTAENIAVTDSAAPAGAPGQIFANTAAAGDAFEIATSNLALEKSQSSAIKKFAQAMVTAHTDSTAKLKVAAASASPALVPDPTLTAVQQEKLDALRAKSGAEFDRAYAAEQVAAHQATLDSLRSYAANPDVAPLGQFATGLVPVVTAHLNMAKAVKP